MTLPDERYRAVLQTEKFLQELLDPKKTPSVPKTIRDRARFCLRHFPTSYDMYQAVQHAPEVFQHEIEAVTRFFMTYNKEKHDNR